MNTQKGFTLIELLIIIALLGALAIGLLAAIDPFEQLKKAHDATVSNMANAVYSAVIRMYSTTGKAPHKADLAGLPLGSETGRQVIVVLTDQGELKTNFLSVSGNLINELFYTGTSDLSDLEICFAPQSKSYRFGGLAIFDIYGQPTNCSLNTCYICVGQSAQSQENQSNTNNSSETNSQQDVCADFDPELPKYPFTCNYSSTWSQYGCTNYCVHDFGCDSYCPAGQRHLQKSYYSEPFSVSCLSHQNQTKDDYCVSGIAASCTKHPYSSSDMDFVWGCSNPRRPASWK